MDEGLVVHSQLKQMVTGQAKATTMWFFGDLSHSSTQLLLLFCPHLRPLSKKGSLIVELSADKSSVYLFVGTRCLL